MRPPQPALPLPTLLVFSHVEMWWKDQDLSAGGVRPSVPIRATLVLGLPSPCAGPGTGPSRSPSRHCGPAQPLTLGWCLLPSPSADEFRPRRLTPCCLALFRTTVVNGTVRLRDWREETRREERQPEAKRRLFSEAFKTRLCWFFTHHPDGCALPSACCPFAHGPGELRPPPTTKKKKQVL